MYKLSENIQAIDSLLRAILLTIPHCIFWKDTHFRYLGCNQQFLQLLGKNDSSEIIGKTDFELNFLETEAAMFRGDDTSIISGLKSATQQDEILKRPDGSIITLLVNKIGLQDAQGKCIGVLGISIDITERKAAEQALQKAKETEEEIRNLVMVLAGSIAHDLRTPLLSMTMLAELFRRKLGANLTDELSGFIELFNKATSEMNQSIDLSLKSLQQVSTGVQSTDDLMTCHLWSCMEKISQNYPFTEKKRSVVHWQNKDSFSFLGNPIYFYRIIFNLFKNSFYQIHQKGKGEIFIENESNENVNILRFKDTAGGVRAEQIENLFAGFNTTKKEGTGIGLAFCQWAMRSMGGEISCHIVDGDCIEFALSFPKVS